MRNNMFGHETEFSCLEAPSSDELHCGFERGVLEDRLELSQSEFLNLKSTENDFMPSPARTSIHSLQIAPAAFPRFPPDSSLQVVAQGIIVLARQSHSSGSTLCFGYVYSKAGVTRGQVVAMELG